MLRVVAILSLPAAVLISCTTAPSSSGNDYSDRGGLVGELDVLVPFVIAASPDGLPAQPTLLPGRYVARLDKLQRDEIVIDIDAPEVGDLTVRLRDDTREFPVGDGGFSLTAAQLDLPYTIHGEHLVERTELGSDIYRDVCYVEVLREYCFTTEDGESSCSVYAVRLRGSQLTERTVTRQREDFGMTFVDAQAEVIVARYSAFVEPHLEERIRTVGPCQE